MLVVILIIGIFAAVALPKYQLAVDKTNFTNYQMWAGLIANAYKGYMLIHNNPPTDIDDIDVDFPAGHTKTSTSKQSCVVFDDIFCCVNYPTPGYQSGAVNCGKKDDTLAYQQTLLASDGSHNFTRRCYAKNNKLRAIRLCETLPYKQKENNNLGTQHGHLTNYTSYPF